MSSNIKPRFPPSLEQQDLLPCPSIGSTSSPLTKAICFYIHEWLLKPLSDWYCVRSGIPMQAGAYILPFGLILKTGNRLAEQEGLAMNLARTMGVPAPRFISYGEPPAKYQDSCLPTLLRHAFLEPPSMNSRTIKSTLIPYERISCVSSRP